MRLWVGFVAFLVAALGAGAVPPANAVTAVTGGNDGVEAASQADLTIQQRVRERRRERQGQRQWISVPELGLSEALPLVGSPGVVILDVTCRERGADAAERIPGAVWQDWTQVEQWAHRYEEAKTLLVYCA